MAERGPRYREVLGEGEGGRGREGNVEAGSLARLALDVHAIYASDRTAPAGWHLKEQLRKELRQKVREAVFPYGLEGWKREIPARVEEYALRAYLKG